MDSSSLGTWVGAIASGIVGVLMWLVTNKQANISKTQLDDALRPRIFRSNYMSWGKLVGDMPLARNMSGEIDENKLIKFIAQRNEALKISGHIIINKRKYHLRFSLKILKVTSMNLQKIKIIHKLKEELCIIRNVDGFVVFLSINNKIR